MSFIEHSFRRSVEKANGFWAYQRSFAILVEANEGGKSADRIGQNQVLLTQGVTHEAPPSYSRCSRANYRDVARPAQDDDGCLEKHFAGVAQEFANLARHAALGDDGEAAPD